MKIRFFLLLCWFPMTVFTQSAGTGFPGLVEGHFVWETLPGLSGDFNQKDAVMGLLRQTGQIRFFVNEVERDWISDFHFAEMAGDAMPEALYSAPTAERGWHTYFFTSKEYRYKLSLDVPGYLHSLEEAGDNWKFIIRKDPGEKEYLSRISHHLWISSHDKDSVLSELIFPGALRTPTTYLEKPIPVELGKVEWLRHAPEVSNDPVFDYNQDGRPDGQGNRIAAFREGHPGVKLAEIDEQGLKWSFVIVPVADPAPGHVFGQYLEGKTFTAGWVPSDFLRVQP